MRTPTQLLLLAAFVAHGCARPPPMADPPTAAAPPTCTTTGCPTGHSCTDAGCVACATCTAAAGCAANETCDVSADGCSRCIPPAPATEPPSTEPSATEPSATEPATTAFVDPKALLLAMEAAYADVRDYTVTLTRRERVKGKLQPQEVLQIKFRKPFSTYVKWTGPAFNGREVLYVRGKHGNKLRAHQGSFPDVTVDLDPRGSLAMKGNRHPITEGSLGDLIGLLVRDLKRAESRPQDGATIQDLGESERHGQKIRCFDAAFAVADGYYAPHVQVCVFLATNLPSRVQVWDARGSLLEDYEFRDLKTNVGLRDADFDSANPRYNF